jgi:hypothetical protein
MGHVVNTNLKNVIVLHVVQQLEKILKVLEQNLLIIIV